MFSPRDLRIDVLIYGISFSVYLPITLPKDPQDSLRRLPVTMTQRK